MTRARLYLASGEPVPVFRDPLRTPGGNWQNWRYGWRTERTWTPTFAVFKSRRRYKLVRLPDDIFPSVAGSLHQHTVAVYLEGLAATAFRGFPSLASVEMYLRLANVS